MKQIISLIVCITAASLWANADSVKFQMADSAFNKDDYATAIKLYEEVITEEGVSSALYYNLGDAYYRVGKKGKALLNYERALRLSPNDNDVRANIEFVNGILQDKVDESANYYSNAFSRFVNLASSNTWAIAALIAFLLLITGMSVYFFTSTVALRKLGFFTSLALIGVVILFGVCAFKAKSFAQSDSFAIVISPEAVLSTSPRLPKNKREEATVVHEGYKLEITDSIKIDSDSTSSMWLNVMTPDNIKAWINAKDVEII